MIFSLIKKDIILVRKYILILFLVAIFAPPFLSYRSGVIASELVFFMVIFTIVLLLPNTVVMLETTYEKSVSYLCTTPYNRSQFVVSKYIFDWLIYMTYCLIYFLVARFLPELMAEMSIELLGITFLVLAFFRGAIIPVEYKFGYERSRYISMIFIMGFPFVLPWIIERIGMDKIDFSNIMAMADTSKLLIFFGGGMLISLISMMISIGIFKRKEL